GRRVESVVDQPLRDVFDRDSGGVLERPRIDDAFMRNAAMRPLIEQRIVTLEPLGNVIGVQDGSLRCREEAIAAHHDDVGPRNRQDGSRAKRRGADGPDLCGFARPFRVTGQEWRKMLFHADRAHAGAAPAMRDAKSLVEIEMPDIGAICAWPSQADLRVEVGAVEIDLSAVGMNDAANLANRGFENAMGG